VGSSGFRDLVAYQRVVEVADDLHGEAARWSSFDRWALGVQLVRSADSIGANIAEAAGRWHVPARYAERLEVVARALNGLIKKPTRR